MQSAAVRSSTFIFGVGVYDGGRSPEKNCLDHMFNTQSALIANVEYRMNYNSNRIDVFLESVLSISNY